jgi:uncharacterized protein (TIGR02145 family)
VKNLNKALGIILAITIFSSCEDKPVPPVISTTAVTQISTIAAVSGGNITDDGGALIISKGVCWNTIDNPTIDNNKTSESGKSLSFTSNISQLLPSTSYYVRAYAVNSAGTSYGKSISFKTLGDKPASNSQNASNIQLTTATINGTVSPNSLETTVTFEYGITTSYGSTVVAQQSPLNGDSEGNVSADLTELTPGKTYHFRIKAENTLGITYSSDMTFTTLGSVPVTTALAATNLQVNSATVNGSVNPNYLSSTIEFEWGTTTSYGSTITPAQSPVTGSATVNVSADLSGLTPGTTYHFRINATNELGTTNSGDLSFTTLAKPDVATVSVSEITTTSALVGGNIISDFGSTITERGICWSTNTNPAISDNKTISPTADTAFSVNITGLTPNITYYLRAYAINSVGTGYGDELILKTYTGTITDIDENVYFTVTIGDQIWMAENLKTTKYNNGDPIGTTSPATKDLTTESDPKYQWAYDGDEANAAIYGRLYTWFAVTDSRNLCPTGWRVPTNEEWTILTDYLINNGYGYGGSGIDIGKSIAATTGWLDYGTPGTIGNDPASNNSSGFTTHPGGVRTNTGIFSGVPYISLWWSATEWTGSSSAWQRSLDYRVDFVNSGGNDKKDGFSIRCLKD